VVWKLLSRLSMILASLGLRENHSGMETNLPDYRISPDHKCCVRTIVVWKLCLRRIKIAVFLLRENHSGMETMLAAY